MESVPDPHLEPASKPSTKWLPKVGVGLTRRIDVRVVAAEVLALEYVEHIHNDGCGLTRREVDVLLETHVHVLGRECVTEPEERARRRLEDVSPILIRSE